MPKKKAGSQTVSYTLPMTSTIAVVVEDQAIPAQAMLDLAAIADPNIRPSWQSLLSSSCEVHRRLANCDWRDLGLAVGVLVDDLGLKLSATEARDLLTEVMAATRRDNAQMGFMVMAHRLCTLAGN